MVNFCPCFAVYMGEFLFFSLFSFFSLYLFFAVLRSYLVPNKPQVYYYNYTLFPKYYRTLAALTKNARVKQALSPSRDSAASSKLHPFMHKIKKESSAALTDKKCILINCLYVFYNYCR